MELALLGPVLLEEARALYLDGAGDEADLTALLHQPPDPPVVVELLHGQQGNKRQRDVDTNIDRNQSHPHVPKTKC